MFMLSGITNGLTLCQPVTLCSEVLYKLIVQSTAGIICPIGKVCIMC